MKQVLYTRLNIILKEARTGDLAFDWSQKSRCANYDVLRVMGYKGAMDALYCGNEKLSLKVGPHKTLVSFEESLTKPGGILCAKKAIQDIKTSLVIRHIYTKKDSEKLLTKILKRWVVVHRNSISHSFIWVGDFLTIGSPKMS